MELIQNDNKYAVVSLKPTTVPSWVNPTVLQKRHASVDRFRFLYNKRVCKINWKNNADSNVFTEGHCNLPIFEQMENRNQVL